MRDGRKISHLPPVSCSIFQRIQSSGTETLAPQFLIVHWISLFLPFMATNCADICRQILLVKANSAAGLGNLGK
jgi:hypothetical protein